MSYCTQALQCRLAYFKFKEDLFLADITLKPWYKRVAISFLKTTITCICLLIFGMQLSHTAVRNNQLPNYLCQVYLNGFSYVYAKNLHH